MRHYLLSFGASARPEYIVWRQESQRLTRRNEIIQRLLNVNNLISSQRFTRVFNAEVVLQATRCKIKLNDEVAVAIDDLLFSKDGIRECRCEVVGCLIRGAR